MDTKNVNKYITNKNGFVMLIVNIILIIISIILGVLSISTFYSWAIFFICLIVFICCCVLLAGLEIVKPNEAKVFTLFGKYYGTIMQDGFYFVNPFAKCEVSSSVKDNVEKSSDQTIYSGKNYIVNNIQKTIPLKEMTFINEKQKVNDLDGNPIEIGIVIIWKIVDPYKAIFNVENYVDYLSTQTDGVIRNVARSYPYDISEDNDDEKSLRGSTKEISNILREEVQEKVNVAGIEIIEARVSHLAYAIEIASAMLQRQQAKAVIEARAKIVEGAVSMVDMAISDLSKREIVQLDEDKKAQLASNLLVVLCSNKDSQPVINSGSVNK